LVSFIEKREGRTGKKCARYWEAGRYWEVPKRRGEVPFVGLWEKEKCKGSEEFTLFPGEP